MSEYVFKLPDLGEGTVDAEIVEWHVKVGDQVKEGDIIADVMTDKANVEVPAPVDGRVLRTSGQPGDLVAVGAELIALETGAQTGVKPAAKPRAAETPAAPMAEQSARAQVEASAADAAPVGGGAEARLERGKVITSPAIRRRAKEAGVDLREVAGSGPRGRILRRDLEA
ncbi:MAG: biotin/lipoyl-containing protein, partial [Pseudomonadales bacterium]